MVFFSVSTKNLRWKENNSESTILLLITQNRFAHLLHETDETKYIWDSNNYKFS